MTATIPEPDLLDLLASEPSVLPSEERAVICRAIRTVARATGGIVTAATIRDALERPVNPKLPGAITCALVKSGALIDTGRIARSGDRKNRNGNRRMPVYSVPNLESIK